MDPSSLSPLPLVSLFTNGGSELPLDISFERRGTLIGVGFVSTLFSLLPVALPLWRGEVADLSDCPDLRGETRPFCKHES